MNSIVGYKAGGYAGNMNQQIQPFGFQPAPVPPNPVPATISLSGHDSSSVVYNKIEKEVINTETAILLNRQFVSQNTNSIPDSLTSQNVLNIKRYASGTTTDLSFTGNKLSLITDVYIYFWVYVIYTNYTKPITILTKGTGNNFGEYTVQILPNKTVSFLFSVNNTMYSIKTNTIIPERTPVFVSIIKKVNNISIYLNNKLDVSSNQSGVATATTNPLLIGYGNNSNLFTGYLDNLMISTFPMDGVALIDKYFSYVPNSLYFEFSNGVLTYNGYNVAIGITTPAPPNNETATLICTLLDNYSNGYSLDGNKYIYYMSYQSKLSNQTGEINEKYSTLILANNIFTRLKINCVISYNVSFEESVPLDGYIKTFAGEVFYFKEGVVHEYDINSNALVASQITQAQADYLLISIPLVNTYRLAFGLFSFYKYVKESKAVSAIQNKVVQKIKYYTMGGINTLIDYDGLCINGTATFFNTSDTLNIADSLKNIAGAPLASLPATKEVVINEAASAYADPIKTSSASMFNHSNAIYIYTGQNVIPLINKSSNIFVDNLPVLEKSIPIFIEFNKDIDLMSYIFSNNITLNRHVFLSCKLDAEPGIYNISIISNTHSIITISGQSYQINTNAPEHILFHNTDSQITIDLKFYYQKLNQAAKFIIVKP